jgi:hypothetical protein
MAGKIFISYRRDDSRYQARMIYDAFSRGLPRENIFMDVDTIRPGVDFVRVLEGWVQQCEVLLVLMAENWVNSTDPKSSKRRLDNPKDFVRIEIRGALTRDIPVVPVLLDGAELPNEAELPDDIKPLLNRHAEFVDYRTFDTDVQRLIKKLGIVGDINQPTISGNVVETAREAPVNLNARGSTKESELEHDLSSKVQETRPRGKLARWLTTVVAVVVAIGSLAAVLIGALKLAPHPLDEQLAEAEKARKTAETKLADVDKARQAAEAKATAAEKARIQAEEKTGQAERERQSAEARALDAEKASAVVPAAAQQGQPNPNQAAAKAILQAADKAIGASSVNSYVASATGWRGYPGQQFSEGDLPRSDLKSSVRTVDFGTKSAKTEYVRVQGNNNPRGGGAGFPVQGEQLFIEVVNGNIGWNFNLQGQPVRVAATDAGDRQLSIWTNPIGFIKAGLAAPDAAATDRYFRPNRRLQREGLRWVAAAMHPPGDRRVQ